MDKKVKFITLGCRVNQYETQGMREALSRSGYTSVLSAKKSESPQAELVVINTCTVTNDADKENRYWIRRARRENPKAKIIVTGCGVEHDREQIEAMPEVDRVLLNRDKPEIASKLELGCGDPQIQSSIADVVREPSARSKHDYAPLSISNSEGKTRAFIKIQDGCNHACSFCKVVLVRGRSRSRQMKDILEEVTRLRDAGYRDFVFAGIQLGAYGWDFDDQNIRVEDVLYEAAKIEGVERLRLSSIEPTDVTDSLIEALASIPKCAHHLHIPLQSGDDSVLRGMNRRYGRKFYIELIQKLKFKMPDFRLTADVMAGFPGETEECFQNTIKLLETVKPLRCHVFPYSERKGTLASRSEEFEVSHEVKKERVRRLIALSDRLGREVSLPDIGKVMNVLVENIKEHQDKESLENEDGKYLLQGLTKNFMKVAFVGESAQVGQIVPVELVSLQNGLFLGSVASEVQMRETLTL